jgi:ribose transport system ATP-binding protein
MMDMVQIDRRALFTRAAAFSGGNQQKIVLAKWLLTQPRVLLLFDPCRGVDVGTKHEIYKLINAFAEAGGAVLLYSSETPELVNLCTRVIVLYRGRVVHELDDTEDGITEASIMHATLGNRQPPAVDPEPAPAQGRVH